MGYYYFMRKKIFIISFIFISLMCMGATVKNNFSIDVLIMLFGREKFHYQVTNQKVTVIEYFFNSEPTVVRVNRNLTGTEVEGFSTFLAGFPLDALRTKYMHESIEGEIAFTYKIRINLKYKEIYVYFKNQKNLTQLNERINSLLPENIHLSLKNYEE